MPSAPLLPQIQEIVWPDVEALGLERIRHEGPHRHVCVVGETGVLLAEPLAEAERELDDFSAGFPEQLGCRVPMRLISYRTINVWSYGAMFLGNPVATALAAVLQALAQWFSSA